MKVRLLVLAALLGGPLLAQTPFGTAFTYQGRLTDMGGPANGTYDIRFTLFDASVGGIQIGVSTQNGMAVSGGLFTVTLDYGTQAFNGGARWLEMAVQKMGGGFTTLSPRQPITATPYALTIFARTVVVKPLGTATQNGSTLLSAVNGITTASASNPWLVKVEPGLYDVVSPGLLVMKPYVDLEGSGEPVTKITSSGSSGVNEDTLATLLCADSSEVRFLTVENTGGGLHFAKAIFVNGTSGTIRHVTARASGATTTIQGITVSGTASPTATDMSIFVDGAAGTANDFGFENLSGSTAKMRNIESIATGGAFAEAFRNFGAAPDMSDVHGVATGGSSTSLGLNNNGGSSVTVRSSSFIAGGSISSVGVQVFGNSSATLESVRAVGTGTTGAGLGGLGIYCVTSSLSTFDTYAQGSGTGATYGLDAIQSIVNLTGSIFNATGSPGYGLVDSSSTGGPYGVSVDGSTLQGGTNSLFTNGTSTTNVFVGGSHFIGPVSLSAPSTHTCAGNWNASYAFFLNNCPP